MWKSEPIWSAVSYYPIFLLAGNISRSTLLSSQFEHNISPQHICLADLVSGASIFSAGIFKSNSTDRMERRTRFLPTGWSPDYSSHTHKREWNAFQTVHLEGSIKCSTSLLLCAVKCDDCTCECIYFFYTLKRRANLGGKSDPSEQACCFFFVYLEYWSWRSFSTSFLLMSSAGYLHASIATSGDPVALTVLMLKVVPPP